MRKIESAGSIRQALKQQRCTTFSDARRLLAKVNHSFPFTSYLLASPPFRCLKSNSLISPHLLPPCLHRRLHEHRVEVRGVVLRTPPLVLCQIGIRFVRLSGQAVHEALGLHHGMMKAKVTQVCKNRWGRNTGDDNWRNI